MGGPPTFAREALVVALCVAATITDLRGRRIPDWLTLPALAAGLALGAWTAGWPGLGSSAAGLALGGLVFLLPAMAGGMGGGDVKMMAAVGALLGVRLAAHAIVYAVVVGAVLALAMALRHGELGRSLRSVGAWLRGLVTRRGDRPALGAGSAIEVPYGVAIALGALWTLATEHWPALRP